MRKLMWFTIGFAAACGLGTYLGLGNWAWFGVLSLVLAVLLWKRSKNERKAALTCLGLSIGLAWFWCFDTMYTAPLREMDGKTVDLEFVTTGYSWETDYGSAVDCYLDLEGKRYKVRLYLDDTAQTGPWTTIETPAKIRLTTDGGANEPTFHRSQGILALCYQRDEAEVSAKEETTEGVLVTLIADLRRWIIGIIDESFPGNTAVFARALLLGDRTGIDYELSTVFKVSGISHIVAVSGLHMSILFVLLYILTFKRRHLLAVFGIPAVVLFMAVTGFTPSVTRAGIMQILMILSLCVRREYDPPTALSFAALVMLFANPLVSASVGFQLSVSSVAGIFLFAGTIRKWLLDRIPEKDGRVWKRVRSGFCSSVSVTLSAQVITTPLVAVYYGTISLVSVVTNLAVLWVITATFYGILLSCLLGAFSLAAAKAVGWVVAWPVRYVLAVAKLLSALPLAAVYTKSVYILCWLGFCYWLILAMIFGKNKRPLASACAAALGLALALGLSWLEPRLDDHRVTVLDVGQGQSVILQHGGKTFLVDCGGDDADDAADAAAETLLSMGVSTLDGLILTHYDFDHAGGVGYLLSRVHTRAVYLPIEEEGEQILAAAEGACCVWVEEDVKIRSDGMEITLFAPEGTDSGNENSVAVLFQTEKCDTLLTGDMSQFRERLLLRRIQLPELELLIVGHHGSKYSTSEELLAAASPDTAFISVGENNPYGHPAQEVLERLKAAGCGIYRTDLSGDLIYRR